MTSPFTASVSSSKSPCVKPLGARLLHELCAEWQRRPSAARAPPNMLPPSVCTPGPLVLSRSICGVANAVHQGSGWGWGSAEWIHVMYFDGLSAGASLSPASHSGAARAHLTQQAATVCGYHQAFVRVKGSTDNLCKT